MAALLLLLPLVSSSTIQTSVGQGVRLSCPMTAETVLSSCETHECTWSGPGGLHVPETGSEHTCLHVEYDRDTCECILNIRVTSLSHAGVWRWVNRTHLCFVLRKVVKIDQQMFTGECHNGKQRVDSYQRK